jgi:hypothetical protein
MVQGNPARAVAKLGLPLGHTTPIKEFLRHLRPLHSVRTSKAKELDRT